MKNIFEQPQMEVLAFSVEDIMTTSSTGNGLPGIELPDHEWD